jgi:hypothetical protein
MKSKNKKHFYIPLSLGILVLVTVFVLKDLQAPSVKETTEVQVPTKKEISRGIASIKKTLVTGNKVSPGLVNSAHLPKDWKSKYEANFFRMHSKNSISNFKVIYKKSIQRQDGKTQKTLEHILVKFNKPNGDPMSFEALLDSKTGTVKQTWNQTKYERKKRVTLNGTNRLMVTH